METSCRLKFAIHLVFALSGFCALTYEVLWTKHLSLTFGTTILAASTVTGTFMGGIALGSYLLGRYVDRNINYLKVYALLEIGIALTALLFAPTLALVETVYVSLSQTFPASPLVSATFQILFSGLLLLPPAALMGGTFPLMCRFFARARCGGQIGRLYAVNTLGATLGAFCCGYVLIPALGLSTTNALAVGCNLLIAAAAWKFSRQFGTRDADGLCAPPAQARPLQPTRHRLILISVGLIGFFSLAYEILWTRVLLLFLGNTSYAFSMMLSAYLIGIALGGALYARLARPALNEKRLFILLATLSGLSILATAPFYDQLAHLFQWAHQASGERWWHLSLLSFLIVFLIMAIPTILSGALLPAAVAIINPGRAHAGEGIGLVVLHNTVGAVLGSLIAGFILIPAFGILDSFRTLATLNILLAVVLLFRFRAHHSLGRAIPVLAAAGILLAALPASWDAGLMNSGIYCYAPKYTAMGGLDKVLEAERVIEVIEGRDTTVAIHESLDGAQRFFTVNGKTDGGTSGDMSTQILVGHLPMLLHPAPEEVLVIGLGTGITLKGMSAHPTERIDCVEISPEVVRAERHFRDINASAPIDPKVKLFINDGRNLLLTQAKTYDVIVSEPSNPWQSGNANLFTADFYRLAASRLNRGGLFCQWIGLYDITPENLKSACATFLETFPSVLTFKAGTDLIMVGASQDITLNYRQIRQRLSNPQIGAVLADVGIGSVGDLVARQYLFGNECLARFAAGAPLNTDDKPILEFGVRDILGGNGLGKYAEKNLAALLGTMGKEPLPLSGLGDNPAEVAAALRDFGEGYLRIGKKIDARLFFNEAKRLRSSAPLTGTEPASGERAGQDS